jgi:hypothetical protein
MNDITQRELENHPLMKQVMADVAASRAEAQSQQLAADLTAAQLRQEQGEYLRRQLSDYIDKYEVQRKELHSLLGKVFLANLEYSRVTGRSVADFQEQTFGDINVPTLRPTGSWWSTGFSTTRAAMTQFFANQGKWE